MKLFGLSAIVFVYQVAWGSCQSFCDVNETDPDDPRPAGLAANFVHPVRYLKVFLVADYEMLNLFIHEDRLLSYMDDRIRAVNVIYKPLNVHLMVTGRHLMRRKYHSKKYRIHNLLKTVNRYLTKKYAEKDYDVIVYFMGFHTDGAVMGTAYPKSFCNTRKSDNAIIVKYAASNVSLLSDSNINWAVAHEIGHAVGMRHDGAGCCPSGCCLMAESLCTTPPSWSPCSKASFETWAAEEAHKCYQRPDSSLSAVPICGNGLVEGPRRL
ncbi:Snake venom metalloproteinase fibrolase [Halotydeus destructor]|nr:Snake venom metalloproteinase fibrolase [Halotydeus destructor]